MEQGHCWRKRVETDMKNMGWVDDVFSYGCAYSVVSLAIPVPGLLRTTGTNAAGTNLGTMKHEPSKMQRIVF